MHLFLCIAILKYFFIVVSCAELCEKVQDEIDSSLSLEKSILCDEHNVQSLIESFYPANQRQAKIVIVNYYINQSEHPLILSNSTTPDYVFLWMSSSVILFIYPLLLQVLSLRTFVAEYSYAHISIAPFSTNDENLILGMLSKTTIWLKSYAEKRASTLINGIIPASRGFSAYRPNIEETDYFVHDPTGIFHYHALLLGALFVSASVLASVAVPLIIHYYYPILWNVTSNAKEQSKPKNEAAEHEGVKLKFRNLLWGFVISLGVIDLTIYTYYFWHVHFTLREWNTRYTYIYPLTVSVFTLIYVFAAVSLIIIVSRAKYTNELIQIPPFFFCIFCLNPQTENKIIIILWQLYGVYATLLSVIPLVLFFCSILMVLFVDPVQVITNFTIYVTGFICLVYTFAIFFEETDGFFKDKKNESSDKISCNREETRGQTSSSCNEENEIGAGSTGKCSCVISCIRMLLLCFSLVMFMLVVVVFGFVYTTIVFFAGSTDEASVFSSIGGLLPLALATAVGWFVKHQLWSYFAQEKVTS